jgi:PEP-CTERM motif
MRRIYFLFTALAFCAAPAHASTVTGSAIFEIADVDDNVLATGSWEILRNRILDFEFVVGDVVWDEFDIPRSCGDCFADAGFLGVGFHFGAPPGDNWILAFSFHDGEFGVDYDVGDVHFSGGTGTGTLFAPGDYSVFRDVPEPGTLALLCLGLLGVGWHKLGGPRSTSRRRTGEGRPVHPPAPAAPAPRRAARAAPPAA